MLTVAGGFRAMKRQSRAPPVSMVTGSRLRSFGNHTSWLGDDSVLGPLVGAIGGGGVEAADDTNLGQRHLASEVDLKLLAFLIVGSGAYPRGVEVAVSKARLESE